MQWIPFTTLNSTEVTTQPVCKTFHKESLQTDFRPMSCFTTPAQFTASCGLPTQREKSINRIDIFVIISCTCGPPPPWAFFSSSPRGIHHLRRYFWVAEKERSLSEVKFLKQRHAVPPPSETAAGLYWWKEASNRRVCIQSVLPYAIRKYQ